MTKHFDDRDGRAFLRLDLLGIGHGELYARLRVRIEPDPSDGKWIVRGGLDVELQFAAHEHEEPIR